MILLLPALLPAFHQTPLPSPPLGSQTDGRGSRSACVLQHRTSTHLFAMRNPTIVAGLFDFLKESEESKAAKEAEWQAIQEKARLRRDPEAFAKYEAEVKARRMREDSARRAEEAVLQGKNDIVVDYAAKSPTQKADVLPDGWSSAVDEASGNTYYFNKEKGITQWNRPYK